MTTTTTTTADKPYLYTRTFDDINELVKTYPPRFETATKRGIFEAHGAAGYAAGVPMTYTRWKPRSLAGVAGPWKAPTITITEDAFEYSGPRKPGHVAWYPIFADQRLFRHYHASWLAQEETVALECPALVSARRAVLADKQGGGSSHIMTVAEREGVSTTARCSPDHGDVGDGLDGPDDGWLFLSGVDPTPITITGVQRRARVHPRLYGNAFALVGPAEVGEYVKPVDGGGSCNFFAISAPTERRGEYTAETVSYIASATYSAYMAVKEASPPGLPVELHIGGWGTGVCGGNVMLMAYLQLIGAWAARINEVVFHVRGEQQACAAEYTRGYVIAAAGTTPVTVPSNAVAALADCHYRWAEWR